MFAEEYTPRRRGFDTHYGYYQGAEGYFDHTYEANEVNRFDLCMQRSALHSSILDYWITLSFLLRKGTYLSLPNLSDTAINLVLNRALVTFPTLNENTRDV